MAVKNHNIKFLFIISVLSLIYGLTRSFVEQHSSFPDMVLIIIGLFGFLVCMMAGKDHLPKILRSYYFQKASFILMIAVLFSMLVVLANFIAFKSHKRWDVTKWKQHTLSSTTAEILKSLKKQIKLTAFYVGVPPKYLEDMFKEYEKASGGQITSEIVDPISNIGYAAQFGSVISGKERKVFVQSENETREIDFTEDVLKEEQLTNAVLRILRPLKTACFLVGHGEFDPFDEHETGFSRLAEHLIANNFKIQRHLLDDKSDIPPSCDVLIAGGPKEHYSQQEEDKINYYLVKGGDALILVEHVIVTTPELPLTPDQMSKNPSLNGILQKWGVKVHEDIVVDLSSHASGDVGSPATKNYMPHKGIIKGLDYTFYVRPRSISTISNRPEHIKVAPLLATMSEKESWGETNRMLSIKYDEGKDRLGPVPIGSVIWEPKGGDKESDTRMIVITDADFLTNSYIDYYSNAQMGINVINWITDLDYQLFLDERHLKVETLDLTSRQKRQVAVVLFLMPVCIIMFGLYVWIKQ